MKKKSSANLLKVYENARLTSDGLVKPENLLYGIFYNPNCTAYEIMSYLHIQSAQLPPLSETPLSKYDITSMCDTIIKQAEVESDYDNSEYVCTEHLLIAIVRSKFIIDQINVEDIKKALTKIKQNVDTETSDINQKETKSKSILDEFCINANNLAIAGKIDPVVGRENEINRIIQILSRRTKNNPVLIGEAGVGKTCLVYALAQRIVDKKVCEDLQNKLIYVLDINNIVAGTKFRGEFEERIKKIIDETTKRGNVILYIDELHSIIGAGSSPGSLDVANILKPSLARGEFSCIGSTTLSEYRAIEKDGALERRFQKVIISEPDVIATTAILHTLKSKYEDFHGVSYSDDIIDKCITLAKRYLYERHFPDSAIDVLDEVGAKVKTSKSETKELLDLKVKLADVIKLKIDKVASQEFELASEYKTKENEISASIETLKAETKLNKTEITESDLFDVISTMTNVPSKSLGEDEFEKFVTLESNIKKYFIGQDKAVEKITKSLIRNKAGLRNQKKPIGVFLFTGGTGVGKTYLTKLLAKNLFTSEEDIIRIDMSEYMESQSVSKLIGSAPGYVGYGEGGQLTEKVRRKPYSIILIDEVEKSHPDVLNIMLQIFDDGLLTDSTGKTVSFKNTIIIMTSNVGSRKASEFGTSTGFTSSSHNNADRTNSIIDKEMKTLFSPEFLNRIDDIIKFNPLTSADITNIINIELKDFSSRLMNNNNITINFDDKVTDYILTKGFDIKMGARPIKRTIQKLVEDQVSIMVLTRTAKSGDIINTTYESGEELLYTTISASPLLKVTDKITA